MLLWKGDVAMVKVLLLLWKRQCCYWKGGVVANVLCCRCGRSICRCIVMRFFAFLHWPFIVSLQRKAKGAERELILLCAIHWTSPCSSTCASGLDV